MIVIMEMTVVYKGVERTIDVRESQSIAEAARIAGIELLGSCNGQGLCGGCSRYFKSGIASLLNKKTTTQYKHPEGYVPYAKTCITRPGGGGVVVDGDDRARMY